MPICDGIGEGNCGQEFDTKDRTDDYQDFCFDCLCKIEKHHKETIEKEKAYIAVEMLREIAYNDPQHFINAMNAEHRTNQQRIMHMFFQVVKHYSSLYGKSSQYDIRNEYTVTICKKIVDLLGEYELNLPYI